MKLFITLSVLLSFQTFASSSCEMYYDCTRGLPSQTLADEPLKDLSLEQCIDFIENDELLEVTPKNLRFRKRELDPNKRKRLNKT